MTRRHLLAGALGALGAIALIGCSERTDRTRRTGRAGVTSADALIADLLISAKERLLDGYVRAIGSRPDLGTTLDPFVHRHEAHIDAVAATVRLARPRDASADRGWATPSPWPSPVTSPAPILQSLADAEEAAAADRLPLVLSARSGRLAALIASIAACESAHATLLRGLSG